jgi:hypothetical protein
MKQRLVLYNIHTDHVMIRLEPKYLIEGKVVMLKCRVFGGETSPFRMGHVCRMVRHIAMVSIGVEAQPEPTLEFGSVANTWNIPMADTTHTTSCPATNGLLCGLNALAGSLFKDFELCVGAFQTHLKVDEWEIIWGFW